MLNSIFFILTIIFFPSLGELKEDFNKNIVEEDLQPLISNANNWSNQHKVKSLSHFKELGMNERATNIDSDRRKRPAIVELPFRYILLQVGAINLMEV